MTLHRGGCHCGAVAFEIEAPAHIDAKDCNCSICSKSGFLHLFVSRKDFKLLSGEDDMSTYTFGTGVAKHYFCSRCGVKSFYIPRSHPDGYSINARCLEPETIESLTVEPFDGRNWEKNVSKLSPISD